MAGISSSRVASSGRWLAVASTVFAATLVLAPTAHAGSKIDVCKLLSAERVGGELGVVFEAGLPTPGDAPGCNYNPSEGYGALSVSVVEYPSKTRAKKGFKAQINTAVSHSEDMTGITPEVQTVALGSQAKYLASTKKDLPSGGYDSVEDSLTVRKGKLVLNVAGGPTVLGSGPRDDRDAFVALAKTALSKL